MSGSVLRSRSRDRQGASLNRCERRETLPDGRGSKRRSATAWAGFAASLGLAAAGCKSGVPSGGDLAAALMTPGGPAGATAAADLTEEQATDVRLALARSMEAAGQWDAAAEAYQTTLAARPQHAHALHRLAVVRVRQGRPNEAEELFERALEANPGNANLFADVGYLDLLRGRDAAAERNLRQALALAPTHAAARGNLGSALARQGKTDEALAAFRAAGAGPAARSDLAFALAAAGRADAARDQLALFDLPAAGGDDGAAARVRHLAAVLDRAVDPAAAGGSGIVPVSAEVPAE